MIWHSVVGSHFPRFMGWKRESVEGEEDSCRELSVSLISAFRAAKLAMYCGAIFGKKKKKKGCVISVLPPFPPSLRLLYSSAHTTPRSFHFFSFFVWWLFTVRCAITRISRLMRSRHISQSVGNKIFMPRISRKKLFPQSQLWSRLTSDRTIFS